MKVTLWAGLIDRSKQTCQCDLKCKPCGGSSFMTLQKKNTFTDLIACAEYLIQNKWTSANRCV